MILSGFYVLEVSRKQGHLRGIAHIIACCASTLLLISSKKVMVFGHSVKTRSQTNPPVERHSCAIPGAFSVASAEGLIGTHLRTPALKTENQKTREGCGCFWGLCGSSGGKFRENSGKIAGKILPNRQMLQILGFRAPGKANLPGTLGPHCRDLVPTFRAGCFLKSTVTAFSSFSERILVKENRSF